MASPHKLIVITAPNTITRVVLAIIISARVKPRPRPLRLRLAIAGFIRYWDRARRRRCWYKCPGR